MDTEQHATENPKIARRGLLRGSMIAGAGALAITTVAAPVARADDGQTALIEVRARTRLAAVTVAGTAAANSTALQSAVNDAATSGAEVLVPGGQFNHQGFTFPPAGKVTVRGTGWSKTVLRNTHATNASVVAHGSGAGTYCQRAVLTDLTLSADTRRAAQVGIDVLLMQQFAVQNVFVERHGVGVRHQASWEGIYLEVSAKDCGTGWLFPPKGSYTPSSPVNATNCSAVECDVALDVQSDLETLQWLGGDFSGCGAGIKIGGSETRVLTFHGINFERIGAEDVVIGTTTTGPAAVSFHGCRFFRTSTGTLSVDFKRGDPVLFSGCVWTNYTKAIAQSSDTGALTLTGNGTSQVASFLTNASQNGGNPYSLAAVMVSHPSLVTSLGPGVVLSAANYSVGYRGWVQEHIANGPGKITVSDTDFDSTPPNGATCFVYNDTDSTIRHAVKSFNGWRVSQPYT